MRYLRGRLTYANVMSSIAVFLILGGASALAAGQLGRNSVGTRQLKKNAVTKAKIKRGAVTGAKIRDHSLTGVDIGAGSIGAGEVGSGALSDNAVTTGKVADGAITSAKVLDRSLKGTDVAPDSLSGAEIAESTLGPVANAVNAVNAVNATQLAGKPSSAYLSSSVYKAESPVEAGKALGDGTFAIEKSCNPGDVLLTGGPADVAATSIMVESFPAPGTTNGWKARIKPAAADNFLVVVLCVRQ